MEALDKYIDASFNDKLSVGSYKTAAKKCNEKISSKVQNILMKYEAAPFHLQKSECNVKFMAMMTCMEFETFQVRFSRFCSKFHFFLNRSCFHYNYDRTVQKSMLLWQKTASKFGSGCLTAQLTFFPSESL